MNAPRPRAEVNIIEGLRAPVPERTVGTDLSICTWLVSHSSHSHDDDRLSLRLALPPLLLQVFPGHNVSCTPLSKAGSTFISSLPLSPNSHP